MLCPLIIYRVSPIGIIPEMALSSSSPSPIRIDLAESRSKSIGRFGTVFLIVRSPTNLRPTAARDSGRMHRNENRSAPQGHLSSKRQPQHVQLSISGNYVQILRVNVSW